MDGYCYVKMGVYFSILLNIEKGIKYFTESSRLDKLKASGILNGFYT